MTITETIQALSIISAYYGQGKADTQTMAMAWHEIIGEHDYKTVERAIINYAREDERDYPVFPSPGQIIESINKEVNIPHAIWGRMANNCPYRELSARAKRLITQEEYESMSSKTEMFYDDAGKDKFLEWFNNRVLLLEGRRK